MIKNDPMKFNYFSDCTLCPRNCHVDRTAGQTGYCGQTDSLAVARASLHMWEEPCISGSNGSGTVFFTGCALGCVYCQNYCLAQGEKGKNISIERLSEIFLELQQKKAHNVNLVTPDHFTPLIIQAIDKAKSKGLTIPVLYNCSGYAKVTTLKLLEGYVDIYLPDIKYMDRVVSEKYSACPDYFEYASLAIEEMVRQTKETVFDEVGIMQRGVIVRHLMLPGAAEDSKNILKYLMDMYGNKIYISIMNQYTPLAHVAKYPELNRKITDEEYDRLVDYAIEIGVENGFVQEGGTASESFIPDFNYEGI